ncbi:MAG: V-type ATP synthase subunit F [Clostridiales bacterium]|nr:V-type ATP synthase subunit F [Clostridiales bacterium]
MYRIAAIGDKDSICGFAALGIHTFTEDDPQEAARKIRHMSESDYGVIFITEKLAAQIPGEIDRFREQPLPSIVLIPGVSGNTGAGMANVSKSVEQAVGSDIVG